ncbi:hypothetical protein MMC19_003237 [Ptychographa xylographoides]|nr:hypothetical protein [Ptychographa xylographoides]
MFGIMGKEAEVETAQQEAKPASRQPLSSTDKAEVKDEAGNASEEGEGVSEPLNPPGQLIQPALKTKQTPRQKRKVSEHASKPKRQKAKAKAGEADLTVDMKSESTRATRTLDSRITRQTATQQSVGLQPVVSSTLGDGNINAGFGDRGHEGVGGRGSPIPLSSRSPDSRGRGSDSHDGRAYRGQGANGPRGQAGERSRGRGNDSFRDQAPHDRYLVEAYAPPNPSTSHNAYTISGQRGPITPPLAQDMARLTAAQHLSWMEERKLVLAIETAEIESEIKQMEWQYRYKQWLELKTMVAQNGTKKSLRELEVLKQMELKQMQLDNSRGQKRSRDKSPSASDEFSAPPAARRRGMASANPRAMQP